MIATGGRVELLADDATLQLCARMMAAADPWRALYFSVDQCREALQAENLAVYGWLETESGRLVGFVAAAALGIGSEPLLEFLCVDERDRGRGVGSQLIAFFEDTLFPRADNMYLFVSDINPGASRLYERLGYKRIGVLPDFNLVGQTEYMYRKTRRPRQERFRPSGSK